MSLIKNLFDTASTGLKGLDKTFQLMPYVVVGLGICLGAAVLIYATKR